MTTTTVYYPRLIKRVRAFMIDSVVIPLVALASVLIGVKLGVSSLPAKLALLIVPILILEPVFVAFTRGTLGHHLVGIKVVKRNGTDKISLFAALLRFAVRLLLGWFSFAFVFITRKHQAIHDVVAGSVMVHRDVNALPAYDLLPEREPDNSRYAYPSPMRRIIVILGYGISLFILLSVFAGIFLSRDCIQLDICVSADHSIESLFGILNLFLLAVVMVQGWRGRLVGCRRKAISESAPGE